MTFANDDTGSTAANRIYTLGGAATSGIGVIQLMYSAADQRWIVIAVRN